LLIDEIWALLPNGIAGFGYGAINMSGLAKKDKWRKSGGGLDFMSFLHGALQWDCLKKRKSEERERG